MIRYFKASISTVIVLSLSLYLYLVKRKLSLRSPQTPAQSMLAMPG